MGRDLIYETICAEIAKLGGRIDGERHAKGGHRMIYWTTAGGAKVAQTVPGYNGSWRSTRHARSNVRRASHG